MLVNLPIPIQLIPRRALEPPLRLPWHPRHPLQFPPDQDYVLRRLPDPEDLEPNLPKQNPAVKPQRPEDEPVVLDAVESVERINQGDVFPGGNPQNPIQSKTNQSGVGGVKIRTLRRIQMRG